MTRVRFEVLYLATAPLTLWLLVQFIALAWLEKRARPLAILFAVPFVPQDVFYNATVGSLLFWERPREWFFTTRLKRYANQTEAERFKAVLNHFDTGHV